MKQNLENARLAVREESVKAPASAAGAGFVGCEPFITREEVAVLLRVPVSTVEAWCRKGKVPAYRFGRTLRFRWSEVQAAFAGTYRATGSGQPIRGGKA